MAHMRLSCGIGHNILQKSRKYYLCCLLLTLVPNLQPTASWKKEIRLSKTHNSKSILVWLFLITLHLISDKKIVIHITGALWICNMMRISYIGKLLVKLWSGVAETEALHSGTASPQTNPHPRQTSLHRLFLSKQTRFNSWPYPGN